VTAAARLSSYMSGATDGHGRAVRASARSTRTHLHEVHFMGISRSTSDPVAIPRSGSATWTPATVPAQVWSPATAGLLILLLGALSLSAKQPWLIASLGATVFMQTNAPADTNSRAYNVVVGHAIALLAAFLAVALMGVETAPSVLAKASFPVSRVWASAVAMMLTMAGQQAARSFHAPAAVTALLITFGIYRPTSRTAIAVLTAVVLVAAAGEGLRRLRVKDRVWHPF
jgi:hypothetical protein